RWVVALAIAGWPGGSAVAIAQTLRLKISRASGSFPAGWQVFRPAPGGGRLSHVDQPTRRRSSNAGQRRRGARAEPRRVRRLIGPSWQEISGQESYSHGAYLSTI